MDCKGHSDEVLYQNEEHVIEDWRKNYPCYKAFKTLTALCSTILWKVELGSNKIEYLAETISNQNVECAAWLFLTACSKMWEARNKDEIVKQKGSRTKDLKNFQPIHIAKNEKMYLGENTEGMSEHPLDKEFSMCMHHGFNQLAQQENSVWTEEKGDGKDERRQNCKLFNCECALFFRTREEQPWRRFRDHRAASLVQKGETITSF